MKSNKLKREPKYIAKFKAFPYQQEAVDAVKDLEYAAIFHEQGLGKTKIAIDVLLYWLSECSMDTALIVTKKQLVANWVNEFKDHTSIKPAVLNTDKNNNYRIFCGPYRVVLTNFETLETEKQQFELYLKVRNVGIIIDESAKLKNPNSKLTKTYFELAPLFQRRIIMTGTPVANRPYDIWAQIYFLDFGESLGADFNEFKKETDLSNKLSRNTDLQEEFEDNISQIFNSISSFTVRETKNSGIITLPDKVYIQEVTEFNRMQEELYERIRTELYRIRKINDSISDINFVPFYSGEKVTAMLWYAETNFLGTVLDKDIKGIRIRQGNILIGDENTLRKCYKEERFNSWMVGELLVFNEDIIPNTRRDDYEKNSAYKELLSQFTEWANEMSRQIRHRSYERSLTQSDKKFLSDESVTDVDGVDISLGTELDSYDMDDSDSVANTDLLSKLSLLMDMGKKKTKYNVLNLNSKFTVDQKQTLEHVFDALYAKYTNAKANDIIQTIIDSF